MVTSRSSRDDDRQYDLVVFGATSFVGQILTRRLTERAGDINWAIAGRNADKLASVAAEAGIDVDHIVADAADPGAMASLAASTAVVVSTVGPYALYGSELVAAVAAGGTDYCDLTGEPQWMRRMITTYHDTAVESGARIVHACGFDSIPSDFGVRFTQRQAIERFGVPCKRISLRIKAMKGGASGGTIASGLNMAKEERADPDLRKVLGSPYCLNPVDFAHGPRQPNTTLPRRDESSGEWTAPFIMAATNTRVVQRSHALTGRRWGHDFEYDEAMGMGGGPAGAIKASVLTAALAGFAGAVAFEPSRRLVAGVLPKPGQGPSQAAQEAGFFDLRFHGTTADGDTITTKVTGDRDPGYGSTAKMLAEAALTFVDIPRDEVAGGFWTPTTMFGDLLLERLVEHAGLTFDVLNA